jgi:SOS-response transcriptional repressor LexA
MTTARLGPKTADLLGFIRAYIGANGFSPSIRDMAFGTGTSSTSLVRSRLKKLEEAGLVTTSPKTARSVRLVETGPNEEWYERSGFELDSL